MTQTKPRGQTGDPARSPALRPDTRAILEGMLIRCRDAAEICFTIETEELPLDTMMDGFAMGMRLIKTSVKLAAALEGPRGEFVHRILVEHRSEPAPAQSQAAPLPPPEKISKTIHRAGAPKEPQD